VGGCRQSAGNRAVPGRHLYGPVCADRRLVRFGVEFNLKPKQLAKTEALTALNRIQVQMSSLNKENGGYTLMNFSQLLDDELQMVLVFGNDVPRVLELCAEVGIAAAPVPGSLESGDPRLRP
jgi:hypothetical protein